MPSEAVKTLRLVTDTVDGDTFVDFIEGDLMPVLQPFDGTNPISVVIMDNCLVPHVAKVKSLISEVGARTVRLLTTIVTIS